MTETTSGKAATSSISATVISVVKVLTRNADWLRIPLPVIFSTWAATDSCLRRACISACCVRAFHSIVPAACTAGVALVSTITRMVASGSRSSRSALTRPAAFRCSIKAAAAAFMSAETVSSSAVPASAGKDAANA